MKNIIFKAFIICGLFVSVAMATNAYAADAFLVSLKYGNSGVEVLKLQQFLVDQGFLKSTLVTGNFLSLTQKAVIEFQKSNSIEATGYFGPLSRAAANSKFASAKKPKSTVSATSVVPNSNTASAVTSNSKTISWQTGNYPVDVGVDINLLRKVSSNPTSYALVEKIAKNVKNNGSFMWIPKSNQTGDDLYVEITCSTTYQFTAGCSAMGTPIKAF
jgi:peptidoglycan hydrolase-like protein with peptidoglycan-binding domain